MAVRDNEIPACGCAPESWLDRYGDDLYRHACFRTGDTALAEDLVQETFLAAWRGRSRFAGRSQEKTWLYGILEHKIQDHYRRQARGPLVGYCDAEGCGAESEDALFGSDGFWVTKPEIWGCDPREAVEREDFLRVLRDCLSALPERQRTAFALRVWHGEDMTACADVLAITVNHLSVLLHRARSQISRCLGRWFAEEDLRP